MKYKVLLSIIGWLSASLLYPNNYHLTHLSSNEGLSQQDVECLIQDQTGFIWIATYDALNMYDGNSFTIFRHAPTDSTSISDNRIVALKEWPSRNEIWVGTDGDGLNCYDMKTQRFKRIRGEKKGYQDIRCLDLHNETLWVGSVGGLSRIVFTEDNEIKITPFILKGITGGIKRQLVLSIGHDTQGNTIVSTEDGLYCKAPNENQFTLMSEMLSFRQIIQDKRGNLWGVSHQSLYFYPAQQQGKGYLSSPRRFSIDMPDVGEIKSILPINEQLAIVGTSKKLFFLRLNDNPVTFEEITVSHPGFFENNELKSLMLDNSMNVWISSSMDGVARFDLNEKKIYPYPLGEGKTLDKLFVQAMTQDSRNRLWVGSGSGCFILDNTQRKSKKIEAFGNQVYGLLTDYESNVWGTSLYDIHFFPQGDETKMISIKNHPQLPPDVILEGPYSLCEDIRNRAVWVGLRSGILQIKHHKGDFSFEFHKKDLFSKPYFSNVTKLFLDVEHNLLLIGTTTDGLYKVHLSENGSLLHAETDQIKEKEHIWTIFKASNGQIYVGTDTGLKLLVIDKSRHCQLNLISNKDERLQTYKITSIIEDDDRNLWLSTGFGLISYNLDTEEIRQYENTDGLSSKILTEGALYDSNTKTLYVGSIKGVNVVELNSLYTNEIPPTTVIRDIKINNTSIHPNVPFNKRIFLSQSLLFTKAIKLKHFENNITISFASLHFSNPNQNRFQYKLKGFSEEWLETNDGHTATFTNLPSGVYTFMVKSSNPDGVWEEEPAQMGIHISPAPWNTVWAFCIYVIVIALILFFIYKYLDDKRKHKHELSLKQLEHQQKLEIAEVKLKYHTNITHELRTPLSLIIAPVDELITNSYNDKFLNSRLQIIKSNADRLIHLINQFLDFRKIINEKYELRIKKINMYDALLFVKKNFSASATPKEISLELFYDMTFNDCWCDIEIVNKVCYNLLSNAIKYTPNKGKISIYATTNPDNSILYLSIEDTGCGIEEKELDKIFHRFYQVPGAVGGSGIGLDLCRQLTTIHHGQIKVKSRPGEGTIFTVELPITREAYSDDEVFEEEPESLPVNQIEEDAEMQGITNKPLILLVEDNFELRSYMSSLLADNAKILVAENGEEGYKMAFNHIPDIIVSDIMMPVMDGIELTQKCKNEMITSHIPIILLTAKDGINSEIEGLTYGADDYIRKPFNPTTLKLKINNFIKLTRKREDADTKEEPVKNLNEREQEFLNTFEKIILDNISTTEFGVDDICRLMYISRMQLYRKMSMIINKKPSQYIREIKMKKAYELIREKGYNITETMYAVGYTSHTHFSRLFSEVNGETPRKLLGMKEKE